MNYEEWIQREQRIRFKILQSSPAIKDSKTYRTCDNCAEVCLCHEEICPNCNGSSISAQHIPDLGSEIDQHIRCRFRYEHLDMKKLL